MSNFSELRSHERIKRYAAFEQQARGKAEQTSGEVRQSWLLIAQLWGHLATDTVPAIANPPRPLF
jgi:hypothetical protein